MIERMVKSRQDIQTEFSNESSNSSNAAASAELDRLINLREEISGKINSAGEELDDITDTLDSLLAIQMNTKKCQPRNEIKKITKRINDEKFNPIQTRVTLKQSLIYSNILLVHETQRNRGEPTFTDLSC